MDGEEAIAARRNHLYLWDTRLLYASRGYVSREHNHFAATLVVALRGRFRVALGDRVLGRCPAVLIGPNRSFSIHAPHADVLIFNQDPDVEGFPALASRLQGRDYRRLDPHLFEPLRDEFEELMRGTLACTEAAAVFETVLGILNPRARPAPAHGSEFDPRVREVVRTLRRRRPHSIHVPELADAVDTSTDRLMRLFGRQLGLPIRRFLLWLKLRDAMSLLQRGGNLTYIAQDAGFYDSAHLIRTTAGMYGVRLAGFNDTRFVQVHHCGMCHGQAPTEK